jgi:SEC-C motif
VVAIVGMPSLDELRKIQKEIAKTHAKRFDIFDFGLEMGLESKNSIEKDLGPLTRSCIWHTIALKAEFKLKLLYTIDGYLSAIDTKNPISTFLLARYLLELVATVNEIDFGLDQCADINLREWNRRAAIFHAVLYRARYSTSDEKVKSIFAESGIPSELFHPIKMSKAIKRLTSKYGFPSAISLYHSFSNMCHHNGSGHKLLAEDVRMTNAIVMPNGRPIFLNENTAVVTLNYPASTFALTSLARTARVAWWSAHCANRIIEGLLESPFTDEDLSTLTDGRVTSADPYVYGEPQTEKAGRKKAARVGRNDPCPCGSGKKYKLCCGRKPLDT